MILICPQGGLSTVIARYGNFPSDYMSGLGFQIAVLMKAEDTARKMGLLNG